MAESNVSGRVFVGLVPLAKRWPSRVVSRSQPSKALLKAMIRDEGLRFHNGLSITAHAIPIFDA